jgi:hypothetical protein
MELHNNRFYHTGLRRYACVADETETYLQLKDQEHMKRGGDDDYRPDTFTVIGLKYHKDLPQHVLFKGDNGRYLQPQYDLPPLAYGRSSPQALEIIVRRLPRYLQFGQEDKTYSLHSLLYILDFFLVMHISIPILVCRFTYFDPFLFHIEISKMSCNSERREERSALHTVTTNNDGLVHIQCAGNRKFWRRRSDFIVADSLEYNFDDLNTVFKVNSRRFLIHSYDKTLSF